MIDGRPAVFLDRDGVLNEVRMDGESAASPRTLEEFHITPDAADSVQRLRTAGFEVVVITNQPDIARGLLDQVVVDAMHERLCTATDILNVEVCPHARGHGCPCRKPLPGMLHAASARLGLDLGARGPGGDRWVAIAAGRAAGTRTVLVQRPWSWLSTSSGGPEPSLEPDVSVPDLADAVTVIVGRP